MLADTPPQLRSDDYRAMALTSGYSMMRGTTMGDRRGSCRLVRTRGVVGIQHAVAHVTTLNVVDTQYESFLTRLGNGTCIQTSIDEDG